eukprot:9715634-Alexandrium_andersonii.AAC.1
MIQAHASWLWLPGDVPMLGTSLPVSGRRPPAHSSRRPPRGPAPPIHSLSAVCPGVRSSAHGVLVAIAKSGEAAA